MWVLDVLLSYALSSKRDKLKTNDEEHSADTDLATNAYIKNQLAKGARTCYQNLVGCATVWFKSDVIHSGQKCFILVVFGWKPG